MADVKRRIYTDSDIVALHKELDEVSCPICIDHPHNAVLLLCSSHEKGCRSYICDSSYRHSNCLDRFKKIRPNYSNSATLPRSSLINPYSSSNNSDLNLAMRNDLIETSENHNANENITVRSDGLPEVPGENNFQDLNRNLVTEGEGILETGDFHSLPERMESEDLDDQNSSESRLSLKCPICRGAILGWEVVDEARKYLNLKKRSCSREACSFVGNYQELRRHARRVHPSTRPSDIDPSRERAWRRLEQQRDYGDIISTIRAAMPGAVVVGDYVIENGDRFSYERGGTSEANSPWWTTFFLFQMIGSIDSAGEPRGRSRVWTRHRRPAGASSERRLLWGENLLGLQNDNDHDEDDLYILSDVGDVASPPRRRRRLARRSDEDQT
ncbi:DUF1644 domain-containing protein [Cephalotus follicularis]|uniref:DUF1644 domain-containing protein n=1 Tax=Cephalotus follicularis TaxID=3775 RepID=A0A1Q3BSB1_CEPFO|nr:DUF1644 domain-containing protein [Cephalotus follicularis]